MSCSDHLPIFLDPKPSTPIPRHNLFRFENLWMREPECEDIIGRSWSSTAGLPIQQKLNVCGVDLLKWGGKLVRDFRNRIAGCKKKMNVLRGIRTKRGWKLSLEPENSSTNYFTVTKFTRNR